MSTREEEDALDVDGGSLNGEDEAERDALEIIAMKARVAEMEQEAALLREMTAAVDKQGEESAAAAAMTDDEKEAVDSRSIYVGNVRYDPLPGASSRDFGS